MAKELEYSSAIKDMPYLFLETKRVAQLLCEGKKDAEIIELSVQNNIFQLAKEKRRRDLPFKVLKRLSALDKNLVEAIGNGDEDTAKLLVFLALIKTDRLFFEFMRDVYVDKFISGQMEIVDNDFTIFLNCKTQESEKIANWKQDNLKKIRGVYKRILCEAGLARKNGTELLILKAICDDGILEMLKGKDNEVYAKSMLLF